MDWPLLSAGSLGSDESHWTLDESLIRTLISYGLTNITQLKLQKNGKSNALEVDSEQTHLRLKYFCTEPLAFELSMIWPSCARTVLYQNQLRLKPLMFRPICDRNRFWSESSAPQSASGQTQVSSCAQNYAAISSAKMLGVCSTYSDYDNLERSFLLGNAKRSAKLYTINASNRWKFAMNALIFNLTSQVEVQTKKNLWSDRPR